MPTSPIKERDIVLIEHPEVLGPHFYIVLKIIDTSFYTVCCTSQVENAVRVAEIYGWKKQIVFIDHNSPDNTLNRQTVASCNDCFEFFKEQISTGKICGVITEIEYKQIIEGMMDSPKLKYRCKKILL